MVLGRRRCGRTKCRKHGSAACGKSTTLEDGILVASITLCVAKDRKETEASRRKVAKLNKHIKDAKKRVAIRYLHPELGHAVTKIHFTKNTHIFAGSTI
jgi:hypothetical protein